MEKMFYSIEAIKEKENSVREALVSIILEGDNSCKTILHLCALFWDINGGGVDMKDLKCDPIICYYRILLLGSSLLVLKKRRLMNNNEAEQKREHQLLGEKQVIVLRRFFMSMIRCPRGYDFRA